MVDLDPALAGADHHATAAGGSGIHVHAQ